LLFLKMTNEQSRSPFNTPLPIPEGADWSALLTKDGDELEIHYRHTLEELGKRSGMPRAKPTRGCCKRTPRT
jgi:type I restriction enzyme M protein